MRDGGSPGGGSKETVRKRDEPIGAGVGISAIAAAREHILRGNKGGECRGRVSGWSLRMRGEVFERLEKRREIDREAYDGLIDRTARRYGRVKRVRPSEMKRLKEELKGAWTHISKQLI
jgi:hypothetical protein